MPQASRWIIRVQRHIGAPGLEHRQHCHRQFQRAFDTHRHAHIRADAEGEQMMRQAVGLAIELAVAQRPTFEDDRTLGLPTRDLSFDQAMHAVDGLGQRCRAVPLVQNLFAFGIADQRQ